MNIRYTIVKNEMATSETDAKYLGKVFPNGVRNRALMTANVLKTNHFAESTFNTVLDAAIAATQELCAAGRDVDWGPVKFLTKMHGSLPYEDAAFEDGTATLAINADATNTTREALATLEPQKMSADELAASIQVSNVMDCTSGTFGLIVGTQEFVILGNGITLDGEGEYAKAINKKTGAVVGTAVVQSVSKGQRAYMKFASYIPTGDYSLEIATKGLIGETTPRIFRKNVRIESVLPVVNPTSASGKFMTEGEGGLRVEGSILGDWLKIIAGQTPPDGVAFSIVEMGETTPTTGTMNIISSSDSEIKFRTPSSFTPGMTWVGQEMTLTLTSRAGIAGAPAQTKTIKFTVENEY